MKKSPKISYKFVCELCDYKCCKQSEYSKHLNTAKHKNLTNPNKKSPSLFECGCGKVYKHRSTLSAHRRVCISFHTEDPIQDLDVSTPTENKNATKKTAIVDLIVQNQEFKELMIEQSKHMHEIHQQNQDLQQRLLEAVKEGKTINNTVNNNQKFNMNFFLNEQCKDAMNISDFLEDITLDIEDLTETGRLGYVNGISRIFVNKLRELDTYKRPLHCTDLKRETLYIRDNNVWEKDGSNREKLRELVDKVANKNCRQMKQWTEEHPNYTTVDSSENQEFMKLSNVVLGGLGDMEIKQFRDKIIRNVIKEVMIHKCV
jgi:hypothetical protein